MNPNTPASSPKNPLRANTAFQRTAAALALNQLSDAMSLITITFMVIAMNGSPSSPPWCFSAAASPQSPPVLFPAPS